MSFNNYHHYHHHHQSYNSSNDPLYEQILSQCQAQLKQGALSHQSFNEDLLNQQYQQLIQQYNYYYKSLPTSQYHSSSPVYDDQSYYYDHNHNNQVCCSNHQLYNDKKVGMFICCPNCGYSGESIRRHRIGFGTCLSSAILCLIGTPLLPCGTLLSLIPCLLKEFKDVNYICKYKKVFQF
jgi:hypothetical protein